MQDCTGGFKNRSDTFRAKRDPKPKQAWDVHAAETTVDKINEIMQRRPAQRLARIRELPSQGVSHFRHILDLSST